MKFLLFNAVVAAAIGYLLLGGNSNQPADLMAKLDSAVKSATEVAATVTAKAKATVAEPTADAPVTQRALTPVEPVKAAPPAVKPAPKFVAQPARRAPPPIGQDVTAEPIPKVPVKAQKTKVAAVETRTQKPADPAAAKRRAQVMGDDVAGDQSDEEPTFMSPAERRRELMRLAEDMELRFLDTVSQ